MKWESAPLWPVVLPSVTGLILAFIPYIFQTDYFTTRNLLTPVIILALVGLLVFKYVDSTLPLLNCCSAAKLGDLMLANTLPQE